MGSTFTTREKPVGGVNKLFGKPSTEQVYLQFVPGIVLDSVTSSESAAYITGRDINSIIAKPHVGGDLNHDSVTKTRYYPLLRGIVDVPAKGDPVLLCTFGGVNYYFGPINTMNNPNWNIDHLDIPDVNLDKSKITKSSLRDKLNVSKNFTVVPLARLQKKYNEELDGDQKAINDIHGDMIYEGRHGNSIRVGSRNTNPYIIISNGREPRNIVESTNDGSIIAILNNGTIRQHFLQDSKIENDEIIESPFVLAGDLIEEASRRIGTDNFDYDYSGNQILQNSDRIIFNARSNNITFSSFNNVIIGSGVETKIISNSSTTIEASNFYIGEQAKDKNEPIVLGEQLRLILEELLSIIETLKVTACIAGLSGPIDPATIQKVVALKNKLSKPKFFSEYHFIEDNGQKA